MSDVKPTKMCSFRMEEENLASMDTVARSQGISRSDWIRRALLAQLVADLIQRKDEEEQWELAH